jgi:hypothetical protein
MPTTKVSLERWRQVKVGSIINLSDKQTIDFMIDRGKKNIVAGVDFVVTRKRTICSKEGFTNIIILDIESDNIRWYVAVWAEGRDFDVYVYYRPDDVPDGNRKTLLDAKCDWLFKDRADFWDVNPYELEWIDYIEQDKEGEEPCRFTAFAPFYGTLSEEGEDEMFSTVILFNTLSQKSQNPDALLLELNTISEVTTNTEDDNAYYVEKNKKIDTTGSYVLFLQGIMVSDDIEPLE